MEVVRSTALMLLAGLVFLGGCPPAAQPGITTRMMLSAIRLPTGFAIDIYADDVPGARSMTISPSGVLFVGTRQNGRVYAVVDGNGDGRADKVFTIAEGLNQPNGVAFRDGDLYVAEVDRIIRFRRIEAHLGSPPPPDVVFDRLPAEPRHGWRVIRFGPDGRLYVTVGAPCNICIPEDPVFATIARMNRDGSGFEVIAHGVRHSMGLDWHPRTRSLWFTDVGPAGLGDDLPPDELNRTEVKGLHFGFPFCHGGVVVDPRYGENRSCEPFTPPLLALEPRVNAAGIRFYTGAMFPDAYRQQLFLVEQGSWDRPEKLGYRIMRVTLRGERAVNYDPFAEGWLVGDMTWGRPVDIEILGDGSLLVSDDLNGVIYRIVYQP